MNTMNEETARYHGALAVKERHWDVISPDVVTDIGHLTNDLSADETLWFIRGVYAELASQQIRKEAHAAEEKNSLARVQRLLGRDEFKGLLK